MAADPFSDILRLAKAETVMSGGFRAGGAWSIRFPRMDKLSFSALVQGSCWLRVEGQRRPVRIEAGDVCLVTVQRRFVLSSEPDLAPVEAVSVFTGGVRMPVVGSGDACHQLGGFVRMDPVNGKLLADVLPPLIHIRGGSAQAGPLRFLLEQLVHERARELPGGSMVSSQLAQLVFVLILRAYVETSPPMPAGWLRALSDRDLAPALALMHGEPARPWGLVELAKSAGMSRTVFSERFKAAAGVAPLAYLAIWRMRLAERLLRETETPISEIAPSLGYSSESAFSNAFKRIIGVAPRKHRSQSKGRSL